MSQQHSIGSHATSVYTENGATKVRYHATEVVIFNDNHIWLNSGGWYTNTTKTRMNQASNQFGLGFSVYQKDYDWFVSFHGKTIPFKDNMIITR